jgi:type II secretory pathway pseudopilin PulG
MSRQWKGDAVRGFTALEALVSVLVLALLALVAVTTFQGSNRVARQATLHGDSQQSARMAVDVVSGDLRNAGYGLDHGQGQQALLHAGPWDIVFNANVTPSNDNPLVPAFPQAIDLGLSPIAIPTSGGPYIPPASFSTGAETITFSLDSDGDGAISTSDQGDDPEENTPNPNDYVLRKAVYGAQADGTNGGRGEPVALLRGPNPDSDGTLPMPLFSYWLDHDNDVSTPVILHGDTNGDGVLSQVEIAALTPVPQADLPLITRVAVTVTAEDGEAGGRPDYRSRTLTTSVAIRNSIRREGVIFGTVFVDDDQDGSFDPGSESGLPNVSVRLSTGAATVTDAMGSYTFEVSAGSYTVTEYDEPGYVSTTPNVVGVTVVTGGTHRADFGDRYGTGSGTILGTVYHDANQDAAFNAGEVGIEDVVITLHTGVSDTTDSNGEYSFLVPVGTYTVVETDSTGWGSTTSNTVEVILTTDGQEETVNFGDIPMAGSGTITGVVFLDLDQDGLRAVSESGIADVPIHLDAGDSTLTDGNGRFTFTVPVGVYKVFEYDLDGYTSTTTNTFVGVHVDADSTVELEFGDLFDSSLDFTVVTVGETERALSVMSADFHEDTKGDKDIVLGTQTSIGADNLHVWHNARKNSGTPITALFSSAPTFSRAAGPPVQSMITVDPNEDGVPDVFPGLDASVGTNLSLWITMTSGGDKGVLPTSPTNSFATNGGSSVLTVNRLTWPGWSAAAIVVGTHDASGQGHVEVWLRSAADSYAHLTSADIFADSRGSLGEVTAIATGDFTGDGYPDLALGQDLGAFGGRVTLFAADPATAWTWVELGILDPDGAVRTLAAADMMENDAGSLDLLVGTSLGSYYGTVELWLNDGTGVFGDPGDPDRIRSDFVDPQGEVLALGVSRLDPDVFPDVIAGVRTNLYAGAVRVYRGIGYLPSTGSTWSHTGSGEAVTLTVDDFNLDARQDIAVGTRTAVSTGELVIYFGM